MLKSLVVLIIGMTLVLQAWTDAQIKIIHSERGGKNVTLSGGMMDLPELASFIVLKGGKLVVDNVFDKNMRPKGYEAVDIQEGDVVMMVNGKRVKTLAELKEQYAAVAIGSSVKLGIQRNDAMMIVAFDKADPEKLPKHKIVMRHGDDSSTQDLMLIPNTGLLVGSKGKEVMIDDIDTGAPSSLKNADVKKGDVVQEINGTQVTNFKSFSKAYAKIAVGENVTITTSRKGEHRSFSFTKAEGGQQKIIKRVE